MSNEDDYTKEEELLARRLAEQLEQPRPKNVAETVAEVQELTQVARLLEYRDSNLTEERSAQLRTEVLETAQRTAEKQKTTKASTSGMRTWLRLIWLPLTALGAYLLMLNLSTDSAELAHEAPGRKSPHSVFETTKAATEGKDAPADGAVAQREVTPSAPVERAARREEGAPNLAIEPRSGPPSTKHDELQRLVRAQAVALAERSGPTLNSSTQQELDAAWAGYRTTLLARLERP